MILLDKVNALELIKIRSKQIWKALYISIINLNETTQLIFRDLIETLTTKWGELSTDSSIKLSVHGKRLAKTIGI